MNDYKRGDVVLIDNPIRPDSHLQGGRRPWVIVQNDKGNFYSPTTIAVPLSTKIKKKLPTHAFINPCGLDHPSIALCEHVRAFDVSDKWRYLCTVPADQMRRVDAALYYTFFYR
mgnify:CR=1 FL=1